jgi:hypothetical protein
MTINLDTAYSWLHHFDASRLSPATRTLVNQMEDGWKAGNPVQAWSDIQRLKSMAPRLTVEQEVAEVMLECGRVAFEMGGWEEAAHLLEDATRRYHGHLHQQAVANWMLGYVYWCLQTRHEDGILAWQTSISMMRKLVGQKYDHDDSAEPKWYMERLDDMKDTLECAIRADCIPPARPAATGTATGAPGPSPAAPAPGGPLPSVSTRPMPSPAKRQDRLWISPVSGQIPAGGFGPTIVDPNPSGYIEVDRVDVLGVPHRLVSLRGSHAIQLQIGEPYVTLQVHGDSMDREGTEGIQDGDYVLLHMQSTAQHNDIVAAEIVNEDALATLKRLVFRRSKVILQPNSSNPQHVEREFDQMGAGFFVRGVALAVLKAD